MNVNNKRIHKNKGVSCVLLLARVYSCRFEKQRELNEDLGEYTEPQSEVYKISR